MAQAKLPDMYIDLKRLEGTIGGLLIGQVVYAQPEAMWVDADKNCFLYPDGRVQFEKDETHTMRVKRTTNGYQVYPPLAARWLPGDHRREYDINLSPMTMIEVDELIC